MIAKASVVICRDEKIKLNFVILHENISCEYTLV